MASSASVQTRTRAAKEQAPSISREEIARAAYGLFERRGGIHGHDQADWFEAERIVRQHRRLATTGEA